MCFLVSHWFLKTYTGSVFCRTIRMMKAGPGISEHGTKVALNTRPETSACCRSMPFCSVSSCSPQSFTLPSPKEAVQFLCPKIPQKINICFLLKSFIAFLFMILILSLLISHLSVFNCNMTLSHLFTYKPFPTHLAYLKDAVQVTRCDQDL